MTNSPALDKPPLPLSGIRVLTFEGFIAGPYASMWLGDMGAEVIKIEEPTAGDPARSLPPTRGDEDPQSLAFVRANRNKKSLTLNLKDDEGKAVFRRLLAASDVVLDNLRPGALERLGFGYAAMEAINPRLIYTSISGFGHRDLMPGPFTDWPAFDVVGQAMAGLMFRPEGSGERPVYLGFPLVDLFSAVVGVCGTLQALFQRVATGKGQRVDIAMYDSSLVLNELSLVIQTALGVTANSGLHALTAPFGSYRARDGFVAIAVLGEKVWQRFCAAIGRPDLLQDPALKDGISRHKEAARLTEIIEDWLKQRGREEAAKLLVDAGVPASPIQNVAEIVDCPQVKARDMLIPLNYPHWGQVRVVGQPIKASGVPDMPRTPPPRLGEQTEALLKEVAGLDRDEIARLREKGVI